jgi:nucleotide-binding universal stress UspA family protein
MTGDGPSLILVGIDGSRTSLRAGSYAAGLARRQGCPLAVVHVTREGTASFDAGAAVAMIGAEQDNVAEIRRQVEERSAELGVPVTFHAVIGDPHHEIVRLATELGAEMVVVGTSESAGHKLVGSLATRLVRDGRWPVTVVP